MAERKRNPQDQYYYYPLVIKMLAALAFTSVIGHIFLVGMDKKPPSELLNLAFLCGGALGGILPGAIGNTSGESSGQKAKTADAEFSSAIGELAAKSIVTEFMRQIGKTNE